MTSAPSTSNRPTTASSSAASWHPRLRVPRRGSPLGILVLLTLVVLAGLLSLAVGSRSIPVTRVVEVLLHPDGTDVSTIVHRLRVPRTVLSLTVGTALGIAGALMQGHMRNPLADPGLLGVTSGAAFAVVVGIYVFGVASLSGYAWFSIVGAGLASLAVFAIGSTRGGPDPVSLVLAGTAVSALLGALTQAVVLRDIETLDAYRFWAVGSVTGRDLDVFYQVLPFLLVGLLLAAISTPGLNLLQLGDDVARSLGMNPARHKMMGIVAVMLLAGGATAACGPIVFVGLVVPHVARFLAGVDYRWVVPYAGLVGALLVVVTDVVGRVVVRPGELQVGIVMALVGGPVFVMLVRRSRMVKL
jgi:iron complex transport system permease protein